MSIAVFIWFGHASEAKKIKRNCYIDRLGYCLYDLYKRDGALANQEKYYKFLENTLLEKDFYKNNNIHYKYSPKGWVAPDGRKYRVLIWDQEKQILYKVEVKEDKLKTATDERDCIDIYIDREPYFPEWSKLD